MAVAYSITGLESSYGSESGLGRIRDEGRRFSRARARRLTIEDQPEPKPGPGELVLRVKSCGICGSDLHAADLPPGLPAGHGDGPRVRGRGGRGRRRREGARGSRAIACARCRRSAAASAAPVSRVTWFCVTSMRGTGLGQVPGAYAEYVLAGAAESLRLPAGVTLSRGRAGRAALGRPARGERGDSSSRASA